MTTPAAGGPGAEDWTAQAADTVEAVVGLVRDKATVPLRTAARALVYGIALTVVGALTLVLLIVAAIRGITLALSPLVGRAANHHHRVWVSYVILGGIFTLSGLFLLRRAEGTPQEEK